MESHMQSTTPPKLWSFSLDKKIGRKLKLNENDLSTRIKKLKKYLSVQKHLN